MKNNNHLPKSEYLKYAITAFCSLFLISIYILWKNWPTLLITTMHWQKEVNAQLSTLLYDAQTAPLSAGLALIGVSFIYGLLHSLGPGHGKIIVSTYIATHPTKVKQSLMLTLFSSLLQAVVAIALVSALLGIFNSSMHAVNNNANHFITLSCYGVVLVGLTIMVKNLIIIWKSSPFRSPATIKINSIQHVSRPVHRLAPLAHKHPLHTQCGCGHAHVADASMVNQASSFKEYLLIVGSIGLRPCSGAIMVLIFAYMMNIYWLGVLSAFAMAAGTILTTSTIAMMTITGKKLITYYSSNQQTLSAKKSVISALIRLSGGTILLLMGWLLLSAQTVAGPAIF